MGLPEKQNAGRKLGELAKRGDDGRGFCGNSTTKSGYWGVRNAVQGPIAGKISLEVGTGIRFRGDNVPRREGRTALR